MLRVHRGGGKPRGTIPPPASPVAIHASAVALSRPGPASSAVVVVGQAADPVSVAAPAPAPTTRVVDPTVPLPLARPKPVEGRRSSYPPPPRVEPPMLASAILREDLEPTEPGRAALRGLGLCLGVVGLVFAAALGGGAPVSLAVAGLFGAVAAAAGARMSYGTRAALVLAASLFGLGAAALGLLTLGAPASVHLLTVATVALAAGLLFRASHRASWIGRVVTGAGLLLGVVWLLLSGHLDQMTRLGTHWQSWLPAMLRLGFLVILLLSLLAFMEENTTGGCRVWAVLLLGWYFVHGAVEVARGLLPASPALGGGAALRAPLDEWLGMPAWPPSTVSDRPLLVVLAVAVASFSALVSVSLCQVLAARVTARRLAEATGRPSVPPAEGP